MKHETIKLNSFDFADARVLSEIIREKLKEKGITNVVQFFYSIEVEYYAEDDND